jgi:LPS export ABC transporter protein LptC
VVLEVMAPGDMKGQARLYIVLLSLLLVLLGLTLFILRPDSGTVSPSRTSVREAPDSRLRDVHFVEMQGDRRVWEASADRIELFEAEHLTRISKSEKQIKLLLHKDDHVLTCYADEAEIDNQTQEVDLRGNLMAQSREGVTMWTDSVHWSPQKRQLLADKEVTLKQEGLLIRGLGLEADLALEEIRILSNVQSSFEGSGKSLRKLGWGETR